MHCFCRELGIFLPYIEYLEGCCCWAKSNSDIGRYELNPWKIKENSPEGERTYKRILWNQIRGTVERSLNSLQDEKLIEWNYYHMLLPSIWSQKALPEEKKFKTEQELEHDRKKREEFLNGVCKDKNSVLKLESINVLNIFDDKWDGLKSPSQYTYFYYDRNMGYAMKASNRQEAAIQNLEAFMKQYAYKKEKKLDSFPPMDEVPMDYFFFNNPQLSKRYRDLITKTYPWLINCDAIWKEVTFKTVATYKQIRKYIDTNNFEKNELAKALSTEFLKFMNRKIETEYIHFAPLEDRIVDSQNPIPENSIGQRVGWLKQSRSAVELHKKLNSFYFS